MSATVPAEHARRVPCPAASVQERSMSATLHRPPMAPGHYLKNTLNIHRLKASEIQANIRFK